MGSSSKLPPTVVKADLAGILFFEELDQYIMVYVALLKDDPNQRTTQLY
jgi:hypothetical protein